MSEQDAQELQARVDAVDAKAPRCIHDHVLSGNNVYVDGSGCRRCRTCRAERRRQVAPAPSRKKARFPISASTVRSLRSAVGLTVVDDPGENSCRAQ